MTLSYPAPHRFQFTQIGRYIMSRLHFVVASNAVGLLLCVTGCVHQSTEGAKSSQPIAAADLAAVLLDSEPFLFWVSDGDSVFEASSTTEELFARELRREIANILLNTTSLENQTKRDPSGGYDFTVFVQFGKSPVRIVIEDTETGRIWVGDHVYVANSEELQRVFSPPKK